MVPPIQPANENASGIDSRPMPTSTATALNSCLSVPSVTQEVNSPSGRRHSRPHAAPAVASCAALTRRSPCVLLQRCFSVTE